MGARQSDLEAAEDYSRTALTLAPDLSDSHSSRVNVLSLGKYFDAAEKEFENVWEIGNGKKDWIEHDPDYDSLREKPRFQALLNKLNN